MAHQLHVSFHSLSGCSDIPTKQFLRLTFCEKGVFQKFRGVDWSFSTTWHTIITSYIPLPASSTQVYPAKLDVILYSPCLFGKKLLCMQEELVRNKQTHLRKQNFSETITPVDKSCMMLFNLFINPVVCWHYFLCWSLFRIITSEIEYI